MISIEYRRRLLLKDRCRFQAKYPEVTLCAYWGNDIGAARF